MKCILAPFFALERCNWVAFSSVFRPKNPKILIFRPKFKLLKMVSKCIKCAQKHFLWTPETPQTHFHTLGVLQGPILVAGCRFKVTWLKCHFRPKSRFFGKKPFFEENCSNSMSYTLRTDTEHVWWVIEPQSVQSTSNFPTLFKNKNFEQFVPIFAAYFALEKSTQLHLSRAKKGAKMHFKRKNFLFLKTTSLLDVFCTPFDSLTPKTKKFRGTLRGQISHFG